MTHLGTENISYDQKKGRESNCQFDSQSLNVWNHPNFLGFRWQSTYCWKAFDNFALDLTLIKFMHIKLWESHLGVSGQNDIWVLTPWPSTNNTIRGKVVVAPKFGS